MKWRVARAILFCLICLGFIIAVSYKPVLQYIASNPSFLRISLVVLAVIVLIALFILFAYYLSRRTPQWLSKTFSFVVRYRYPIACVVLLILTFASVNGSSIKIWDNYTGENSASVIAGKSRGIRSDEWLVQTPYYMSQVNNDFPVINPDIRSDGQNMEIAGYSPVKSITSILKPFHWGFFIFNAEMGFAWWWNIRYILLFLLSFEFCRIITRRNDILSVLGAFMICLAPPVQWWYSTQLIEMLIFSEGIMIGAWYFLTHERPLFRRLNLGLAAYSTAGFCTLLYPAFQVPLGFVILAFIIPQLIFTIKEKRLKILDWLLLPCFFIAAFSLLIPYLINGKEAFSLILNTSYPGRTTYTGGGLSLLYLMRDPGMFMLPWKESSNPCETSIFFILLPALLAMIPITIAKEKDKKRRIEFITLSSLFAFMLLWCLIPFPEAFAQATLFSFVSPQRLLVIMGFLSVPLIIKALNSGPYFGNKNYIFAIVIGAISLLLYTSAVIYQPLFLGLNQTLFEWLGIKWSIISIAALTGLCTLFAAKARRFFTVGMLCLLLVSSISVNPISIGLAPLTNTALAKETTRISQLDPSGKWLVLNSGTLANYLIAQGIPVINGVHYYPDLKLWQKIDPSGKQIGQYNRYAHVIVSVSEETTLSAQADVLTLSLKPQDVSITGAKYILSPTPLNYPEMIYLESIDNLNIYKLK